MEIVQYENDCASQAYNVFIEHSVVGHVGLNLNELNEYKGFALVNKDSYRLFYNFEDLKFCNLYKYNQSLTEPLCFSCFVEKTEIKRYIQQKKRLFDVAKSKELIFDEKDLVYPVFINATQCLLKTCKERGYESQCNLLDLVMASIFSDLDLELFCLLDTQESAADCVQNNINIAHQKIKQLIDTRKMSDYALYRVLNSLDTSRCSPSILALEFREKIIKQLVIGMKNVDYRPNMYTSTLLAHHVKRNNTYMVELLLHHGAHPDLYKYIFTLPDCDEDQEYTDLRMDIKKMNELSFNEESANSIAHDPHNLRPWFGQLLEKIAKGNQ